jgi:mRNA-degrading endonuclease YafQ of YafQ-DinJ toxin-antitoxin module
MPAINKTIVAGSFQRAYRRRIKGTPQELLFETRLRLFLEDPFQPQLGTHKLKGRLSEYWAFTISYDCRAIFKFLEKDTVILVDIGGHDEVY